jgi:tRNA-modifying protein YgfZ
MTAGGDSGVDPGIEEGYRALRASAAARSLARDVVRVAGPDSVTYLQGQLSQDVAGLPVGEATESLLLSPQGRIDAFLRVGRLSDDEFVLDVEGGFGSAVVARLERFRLRTKVEIDPLEWACTGFRGPGAREAAGGDPSLRMAADWPGLSGIDLLGPPPPGEGPPWVAAGTVVCPPGAWEAARIESGQPVLGREIDERTIAAEVGLVERTVSFTKGCFTGQELVARLDARGSKVARRLCGLVVDATSRPAEDVVGAAVWSAAGEEGRGVGRVTSAARSPGLGTTVALAVLHRSVIPPARVFLRFDGSEPGAELGAEARPLPLVAGD